MTTENLTSNTQLVALLRKWHGLKGESCFREAADEIERLTAACRERDERIAELENCIRLIAAIEPVDGKASKNRGAMLRMQALARRALPQACDCQNPEPVNGVALVSNECPVHNINPRPIGGSDAT
jgi:hypothetical protein